MKKNNLTQKINIEQDWEEEIKIKFKTVKIFVQCVGC